MFNLFSMLSDRLKNYIKTGLVIFFISLFIILFQSLVSHIFNNSNTLKEVYTLFNTVMLIDNTKVLLPPPVAGMNIPKDVDLSKLECDVDSPVSNWKPDNTISLISVILQFISAMVAAFISYIAIKKKKE